MQGPTITFSLLPTVYRSWMAKANLRCDFSFARSLLFLDVSHSPIGCLITKARLRGAVGLLWGNLVFRRTASSGSAVRSQEDSVLEQHLQPLLTPLGSLWLILHKSKTHFLVCSKMKKCDCATPKWLWSGLGTQTQVLSSSDCPPSQLLWSILEWPGRWARGQVC